MLTTPAHWIAAGGGIGRFPIAPGTAASLAAILIGALALWIDHRVLTLLAIVTCVVGVWAVRESKIDNDPGGSDPGWIVIDEFAGQWIAMIGLTRVSLVGLIAAFVLFRFFDITKLGPIGWADRQHGAVAVMADDIIAGLIVAAILFVASLLLPKLL
jgi:phosphatidylglycerophosphatase A